MPSLRQKKTQRFWEKKKKTELVSYFCIQRSYRHCHKVSHVASTTLHEGTDQELPPTKAGHGRNALCGEPCSDLGEQLSSFPLQVRAQRFAQIIIAKLIKPHKILMWGNVLKDNGILWFSEDTGKYWSKVVFLIRDILRQIRILGSVHSLRIQFRFLILLFSSVAFKMPTKNKFIFYFFTYITYFTVGTLT